MSSGVGRQRRIGHDHDVGAFVARGARSGGAVSRVDAGRETLPGGQPVEQVVQYGSLVGREAVGHGVLVGRAEAAEFFHELSAFRGQVERMVPAVGWVPASLDKPTFFEPIHEEYESAGRSSELPGDRLLALARIPGDQPQQPGLGRGEVQFADALCEPGRGVRPELGKQECASRPPWGDRARLRLRPVWPAVILGSHGTIISA
jgi:hypothetical protein